MINYVIYGNTDYLDILTIQTDYIKDKGNLILMIDKNELDLTNLYSKYDKVIFYDKNDSYAKRVLSCLEQISLDYILFIHDMDILIDVDNNLLTEFFEFLRHNNFDRIDLKHSDRTDGSIRLKFNSDSKHSEWKSNVDEIIDDDYYLIKQDDIRNYIYNVNPSIWKRESFISLLKSFQHKNYRNIEDIDVQQFAKNFTIFKIFSKNKITCGYYHSHPFFKFLHITHNGKLLELNQNFTTTYNQSYRDVSDIYIDIVNKYSLRNSKKWVG
jgi:hypothetical protein